MREDFKERDYEIRDGTTRRELHEFFDDDGIAIDVSTYTIVSVIHTLGDPTDVLATLDLARPETNQFETFLTLAMMATLADTGAKSFGHYTTYETPAGDVVMLDCGTVRRLKGPA